MKMNQEGNGFWTHFWASVTAISSAAGLTTEQWVYVFCAILGAALSLSSFMSNKRSLKAKQIEDEKRTELLRIYLTGREDDAKIDPVSVAEDVNDVIGKVDS